MFYEVIYFTDSLVPTHEETDIYIVYEVKDNKSEMRKIYENAGKSGGRKVDDNWHRHIVIGNEKRIEKKDLFLLLL